MKPLGDTQAKESRETALRDGLIDKLRIAGIEVITDEEEAQRVLDEANGKEEAQRKIDKLAKAANVIRGWLKNDVKGKVFTIELPVNTLMMIHRVMGRDYESHNITYNGIRHGLKNHGVGGNKLTEKSIPVRNEDAELIPYIITAPDYVEKSSTDITGRESLRFYKSLSNGYVVVVEKEYKNSPDDMDTITMWATLSSRVIDARSNERPLSSTSQPADVVKRAVAPEKTNARTVITSFDAAKIRKDAETAIKNDEKVSLHKVFHGSGNDFEPFPTRLNSCTQTVERFNKDLELFKSGKMKSNEVLILGHPSQILRECGINSDTVIRLTQSVLSKHLKKHNLKTEDLRGLPKALATPILVYKWGSKAKSHIIITDMEVSDGRKITVAIHVSESGSVNDITDIASVHGKDAVRLISEINTKKTDFAKDNLQWADKEKVNIGCPQRNQIRRQSPKMTLILLQR